MTRLRCGKEVSFVDRRSARRHAPHLKPRLQELRKPTRKMKSKVDGAKRQSRARNIRYLKHVRAYQAATGDSATTLRQKRLWLQTEHQARRIHGKPFRELRDLYSKHNISKPKNRRLRDDGLTDAAKEAKERLEEVFEQRLGARRVADAVRQPLSDDSSNAGEIPSASTLILDGSHTDIYQAVGQPSDGEAVCDAPNYEATGQAVESDTESGGDLAVKDESSTEEDNYANHSNPTAARTTADNDAAARQWALEHGYELFDATIHGTGVGEGGEGGEEEEEEEEVEVKVEEDADE